MTSIVDVFEGIIMLVLLWFIVPTLLGALYGDILMSGNWLVYLLYIIFYVAPFVYFYWIIKKKGE